MPLRKAKGLQYENMPIHKAKCLQLAIRSAIAVSIFYNKRAKEIEKCAVDIFSRADVAELAGFNGYVKVITQEVEKCKQFYKTLEECNKNLERFDHLKILSILRYFQANIQDDMNFRIRIIKSHTGIPNVGPIREKLGEAIKTIRRFRQIEKNEENIFPLNRQLREQGRCSNRITKSHERSKRSYLVQLNDRRRRHREATHLKLRQISDQDVDDCTSLLDGIDLGVTTPGPRLNTNNDEDLADCAAALDRITLDEVLHGQSSSRNFNTGKKLGKE